MTITIQNKDFQMIHEPIDMNNGIYMGIVAGPKGAEYSLIHNSQANHVIAETKEMIFV